jgi:sedoheptulokinase
MPNMIGLDLGTTTITGVLVDVEAKKVLALAERPNDSAIPQAHATRAEQDVGRLAILALEVLCEIASAGHAVDGIAVTGQKHGLLCIDCQGRPLTPLISWQDQRTAEPLPDDTTTLDEIHRRLADLSWQDNGCRLTHGYGAATLFWLVQQGELPVGTDRACSLADWLVGQLTGGPALTEPTLAASWGVYDLVAETWNHAFLDRLGLEARLFPPVRPSGEKRGGLVRSVARQVGLRQGVEVFNAVGDTQASFLGSLPDGEGASAPDGKAVDLAGMVLFNLGTGGQICWIVPQFEVPSEAVETRPLPHHRYLRVGASLCGGAAYAWLNHTVRDCLGEFGLQVDERAIYERLNSLALKCRDTEGLQVRTTFLGVRGNPAIRAGAIDGITLGNLRLGALARATLIGVVEELRGLYLAHGGESMGHNLVMATGGGVRKNPLLRELVRERFGLPVQMPRWQEPAAVGAALLPFSGPHSQKP